MVDEKILDKIQKVYRVVTSYKSQAGKVYSYLVWHGFCGKGKLRTRVYIGKELPERLKCLIPEKRFTRSPKNYNWPELKRRVPEGDPGVVQVGGS